MGKNDSPIKISLIGILSGHGGVLKFSNPHPDFPFTDMDKTLLMSGVDSVRLSCGVYTKSVDSAMKSGPDQMRTYFKQEERPISSVFPVRLLEYIHQTE